MIWIREELSGEINKRGAGGWPLGRVFKTDAESETCRNPSVWRQRAAFGSCFDLQGVVSENEPGIYGIEAIRREI